MIILCVALIPPAIIINHMLTLRLIRSISRTHPNDSFMKFAIPIKQQNIPVKWLQRVLNSLSTNTSEHPRKSGWIPTSFQFNYGKTFSSKCPGCPPNGVWLISISMLGWKEPQIFLPYILLRNVLRKIGLAQCFIYDYATDIFTTFVWRVFVKYVFEQSIYQRLNDQKYSLKNLIYNILLHLLLI